MSDAPLTEQQDDSARRLTRSNRAVAGHLRIVLGRCTNTVHEVPSTGIVIGRDVGEVRIDDSRISRQHVRIERDGLAWRMIDLGSRNGGFVDGRGFKANEYTDLRDGTVIRLGDSLLVFRAIPVHDDGYAEAEAFPGVSPAAVVVRRKIAALAEAPGHALILGETGTGKERVARAIAEPRRSHPFVAQNCGELGRDLARAELFGHTQGAFTGATHSKRGLVEAAGDGVLFLDEVGELSRDVQKELLRFLEDGTYRPVGPGAALQRSGARVVAATNVDLDRSVEDGNFRRDLLARLRASNAPLELPPLRERREDIPQWCRLFLRETGQLQPGEPWTAGALECLLLFPWRENLRELRGLVRATFADRPELPCATERLPERIYAHRNILRKQAGEASHEDPTPKECEPSRAEIEGALRQTRGHMVNAARLLQIERTKLYRLCKILGIGFEGHRAAVHPEEK